MHTAVWIGLLLGAVQSHAETIDFGFHSLVCQQCTSWCSGEMTPKSKESVLSGPPGPAGPMGRRGFARPQGEKGDPGQTGVVNMTAIKELIEREIEEALGVARSTIGNPTTTPSAMSSTAISRQTVTYSSCSGINVTSVKYQNETGGVFDISIPGVGTKEIYCNTKIDGGDWIVFQRRMDGSVDFYRNWTDYVTGFGTASGEYWLGLEAIHQMTKNGTAEMRIDMIGQDGTYYFAKYSYFQIGPASDNYRLAVAGYSGNATDRLEYHNDRQFSTKDRDNDLLLDFQCADYRKGAWWYHQCAYSNLNGVYGVADRTGIAWRYKNSGEIKMSFTEMKFKNKI